MSDTQTGYTVWDIATGRIVTAGVCAPHLIALQAGEGHDYIEYFYDDSLIWFPGSLPVERPAPPVIPTTAIVDVAVTIEGLQPGAIITLTDAFGIPHVFTYDPADPLVLLDPGTYTVAVLQAFPHHNATQQIEVSDA